MPSSTAPLRLHFIADSPVAGLAVAQRRVESPLATVICVHGALDRGGSFSRLARRLENFDVVAYDRRGYQGSRGLGPVDLGHHVADLRTLIHREAPGRPIILFGHSFGGVVALSTAIQDPSGLSLLINYESPAPWILPRRNIHPPLTDNSPAEVERFFRRVVSDVAWDRLSETQRESRRLDAPALLSDLTTVRREHAPFNLADLRVPTTYAFGTGNSEAADYYRALASAMSALNPARRPGRDSRRPSRGALGSPSTARRTDRRALERVRVGITGSTGLIGRALEASLRARGDTVVPFVRPTTKDRPSPSVRWDPSRDLIDFDDLRQVGALDAVVHLAGSGIGDRRWTSMRKAEIVRSRVEGTTLLASSFTELADGVGFFASASAIGWYGNRGDDVLDEASPRGEGFLSDVCVEWERATAPASASSTPVAHLRSGIVISARGGALKKQLPAFRVGLGAYFASGHQWMSPISIDDEVRAILWIVDHRLEGPFNLVAPEPTTNRRFSEELGAALHRPVKLRVPRVVLSNLFGAEMADELLLTSQRVVPTRLLESGFAFLHRDASSTIRAALSH